VTVPVLKPGSSTNPRAAPLELGSATFWRRPPPAERPRVEVRSDRRRQTRRDARAVAGDRREADGDLVCDVAVPVATDDARATEREAHARGHRELSPRGALGCDESGDVTRLRAERTELVEVVGVEGAIAAERVAAERLAAGASRFVALGHRARPPPGRVLVAPAVEARAHDGLEGDAGAEHRGRADDRVAHLAHDVAARLVALVERPRLR
jgi:hypothetical protein